MAQARWGFAGTLALGSALLFLVEPIAARQLLPIFGGSAAVWLTCLVFFQAAVLAGYLYAHWISVRLGSLAWLHGLALALSVMAAIGWAGGWLQPIVTGHPMLGIVGSLAVCVGLPFGVLGSTGPLLQVLLARREQTAVPYWMFGLSNVASLVALFAYPAVIEPHTTLHWQRFLWAVGAVVYASLSLWLLLGKQGAAAVISPDRSANLVLPVINQPSGWRERALWFLLPLVASMQLSAVTGHLTANVAAMPLLWVLPLAAYLLSFVIAFDLPFLYSRRIMTRLLLVMLAALGYLLSETDMGVTAGVGIAFFTLELLLAATVCHAETYALRPPGAEEATVFYLAIAAGGAAGAFLVGIVAPLVFRANYDLALVFGATALAMLAVVWSDGWSQRVLWSVSTGLGVLLVLAIARVYTHSTLLMTRNFYGSLRVKESVAANGDPERLLMNGQTNHGSQIFSPATVPLPTTYYARDSGIGLALTSCCAGGPRRIGVIGLGAGSLAAYAQSGDRMRFYEINPAVRPAAEHLFTYLRTATQAGAVLTFVEGDARTSLAAEPDEHFDVLVVDAFSGDAIPVHLLTREALRLYRRHLSPGGIIAFHISNRYVDLAPAVNALATDAGLAGGEVSTGDNAARGELEAVWVLVGQPQYFLRPEIASRVRPVESRRGLPVWTDDFSSLWPLMRW